MSSGKYVIEGANLYITRRVGETIELQLGDLKAAITVSEFDGKSRVRLAIQAPREIRVTRPEYRKKRVAKEQLDLMKERRVGGEAFLQESDALIAELEEGDFRDGEIE